MLSSLQRYGFELSIKQWFFPIFLIGMLLLVLFGYLEDRLGFYEAEQKVASERTPQMKIILDKLDKLEKDLQVIKKKR